ncbi:MAG TPA: AfsR/SARP family transcriptional regulator [Pseudonocardiaceae bacterium]
MAVNEDSVAGPRSCLPSAAKKKVLLATLLARANQVVPTGQLIEEIWGPAKPRTAKAALQVYVAQLRQELDAPGQAGAIRTEEDGYLVQVGAEEFDLYRFEQLSGFGRNHLHNGRYTEASVVLSAALGLWRGPALHGVVSGPLLGIFATRLDEMRLAAREMCLESDLHLGRHRDVVSELFTVVAEHPLQEAFCRQLMLALYRSERQAEALQAYRRTRDLLNRELGVEPGRALRRLQQAILTADRSLDFHPQAEPVGRQSRVDPSGWPQMSTPTRPITSVRQSW